MSSSGKKKSGMGRALKIALHQEEILKNIEEQPATVSHLINDVRRALLVHLCANPCDHVRGTARIVGKSAHTTTWHLNILCDAGYLESTSVGRKRIFWPKGMLKSSQAELAALLRKPVIVRILAATSKSEKTTEKQLQTILKVKQQNLNVWLKQMCASNILIKSGRGKGTTYEIAYGFETMITGYRSKTKLYSVRLLKMLEKDGLLPKKPKFRGSVLSVTIILPSGQDSIKLECNPFATVSKLMK